MRLARVLGVAACLFVSPAVAQPAIDACLNAHEIGQRAEQKNQLLDARQNYRACNADPCPQVVQKDCAVRLERVEQQIPSIVVRVAGASISFEVSVDSKAPEPVTDKPIAVDPGEHVVRVWNAAGKKLEKRARLERGARETLAFDFTEAAPAASSETSDEPEPARKSGASPFAYVLGGVAVVGIAGFVGFGLAGRSKQSKLDDCKPDCPDHDIYDDMKRDYLFADISLGVAAAAGIGAFLVLRSNKSNEARATAIGVTPSTHGASLLFGAGF